MRLGVYRHFKGTLYFVIGTAEHSETGERMVIYRAADESDSDSYWVRPLGMFEGKVDVGGKRVPRFTFVNPRKRKKVHHHKCPICEASVECTDIWCSRMLKYCEKDRLI